MSRITNGRWAMSAFGTASSAALSSADTVYSVTPLYHPSGLMMSVGGAIAGGARLAMAADVRAGDVLGRGAALRGDRRLLHVDDAARSRARRRRSRRAPPPGAPVHRLGDAARACGAGCRSASHPARVLEFYASTETGAILVNLRGAKPGAMGRPLPGSAEVRIAAYDPDADQLVLGPRRLRARVRDRRGRDAARPRAPSADRRRRPRCAACSARDDAWLSTGDLFRRDADGDYWRLDSVRDVIRTAARAGLRGADPRRARRPARPSTSPSPTGCAPDGGREELAVAAVTRLRRDRSSPPRCISRSRSPSWPGARPGDRARRRRDPGDDLVPAADADRCATQGLPDPLTARRGVVPGPRRRAVPAAHRAARRRLAGGPGEA